MAGSVSISKQNRSEASLQPQLLKKRVSEFRLNIMREVRMRQLRLETPNLIPTGKEKYMVRVPKMRHARFLED